MGKTAHPVGNTVQATARVRGYLAGRFSPAVSENKQATGKAVQCTVRGIATALLRLTSTNASKENIHVVLIGCPESLKHRNKIPWNSLIGTLKYNYALLYGKKEVTIQRRCTS